MAIILSALIITNIIMYIFKRNDRVLKGKNVGSFSLARLCEQCQASYVTMKPMEDGV